MKTWAMQQDYSFTLQFISTLPLLTAYQFKDLQTEGCRDHRHTKFSSYLGYVK